MPHAERRSVGTIMVINAGKSIFLIDVFIDLLSKCEIAKHF